MSEHMHPVVEYIEFHRERLGLSQTKLCARARVRQWTWKQIREGHQSPRRKTIEKLDRALFGTARDHMEIRDLFAATMEITTAAISRDIENVRGVAPKRRRSNSAGLLKEARALAVCLVNSELGKSQRAIATAIGMSRSGVGLAIERVNDRYDEKWLEVLRSEFRDDVRRRVKALRHQWGYVNL
jgi:transcriptional regulator with XRE-family HTH domain